MNIKEAKIALVFDWMTTPGGAEKVNLVLHEMFPKAPIFTSIYNPQTLKGFENAGINTSFIQKMPFAKKKHQLYLGMMPYAYELFDLSEFDIVISSSHSCAKGIITKPNTMHVCYCHSPMRYAWDNWHSYIREYKMNPIIKFFAKRHLHKIRLWDRLSADRVDHYIANSSLTKKRIGKYYGKNSKVIHPMVEMKNFETDKKSKGYFLAVGRLIPYKKFDLIVKAFNELKLPIKIAGTGIMEEDLKAMANDNIDFLGYVSDEKLQELYSECEALIFPQVEDFGIIPLEAMASGKPVIAYKEGGALDTIIENKTGIFFTEQNSNNLKKAVQEYLDNKQKFSKQEIIEHAKEFDTETFQKNLINFLEDKWEKFQKA
ncbi:glycosyltransferase [Patescibacteria group bacterium]|nr:glycosyltransferase [Patescibacteria group bacterium]